MNVIYNAIGDKVNLPVSILKKVNNKNHNEDSSNDEKSIDSFETDELHTESVSINLKSFNSEPPRCVGFDQCQHDCYVYAGSSNSNNFNCPTCKTARFQPCSRSFCKGQGTESCDHLLTDGVALKKLWYRPILLLIMDLLSTQHFLTALNYDRKQIHGDSLYYSDFMDGAVPTQQLKEMQLNFKTHMEKKTTSSQTTKSVILLFSEFYDGVQLFKSRYNDFWPLCISIMNLPPLYRGKMGVGFFLAALYAGKHQQAEKFLLIDCFSEELNLLYNGVERTINGQTYFIQARLILHILDTKAAEPILCVQMQSNARLGCALCGLIHGVHMGPKCCFIGHRHLLPPRHYLRFFGQSGRCCPTNFYSPEVKDMWYSETFISATKPVDVVGLLDKEKNSTTTRRRLDICEPCGEEANSNIGTASDILRFFRSKEPYQWNHEDPYNFNDFVTKELKHFIYYRHFDFRAQRPYRRIASDVHLKDAREAKLLNDNKKSKGSTKKNVNGIQDVWPFDRLPYSDIATQIDWPLIHAITGIEELLNGLLFGEKLWESRPPKANKNKDVEPLKKPVVVKTCPPYHPVDCPWEATADEKKRCNAWLSCVILPSGCNNSWDLKKMISNDGVLKYTKMDQTLKVYTCFMSIIMYNFNTVPNAYKWFFLMFAHDMTRLQQSSILKSNVDILTNDIIETVCIFEALFFASASTSQLHQLIHMAPVIKRFGPPMGISEFPGERSVGVLKRRKTKSSNTGGRSFERRIFISQVEKEIRVLRSFYKEAVSDEPAAVNNKRSFKLDALGRLHYTERPFAMGKKESESTSKLSHHSLSDHEFHWFLKGLLYELSKYEGQEAILETSTMHRLFQLFKATKTSLDFTFWVQNVAEGKIALDDDECSSLAKELTSFKFDFFQNAYIYGIKMKSRGSNLREKNSPNQTHEIVCGEFTDIKSNWSVKQHYSSWCKFDRHITGNLSAKKKAYYGQINAFFQVSLRDVLLDKLMLASMTVMNYTTSLQPCSLECVKVDSFVAKFLFVALSDILPTSIAIIPIDNTGKPMATTKNKLPMNAPTINSYYSLYKGNEHYKLEKLVMVALHPERSSMKPQNTAFKQFLFEE